MIRCFLLILVGLLVIGPFCPAGAESGEVIRVVRKWFEPRVPSYYGNPKTYAVKTPALHGIYGQHAAQTYQNSGVIQDSASIPRYRWGYFGAKSRPTCTNHWGYYGDFKQIKTGWEY